MRYSGQNEIFNYENTCEIIAEVANTHEGDFQKFKKLIRLVSDTGCNNIKYQIFNPEELMIFSHGEFDLLKSYCFSNEQWYEIGELSKNLNLNVYCDIFDKSSLNITKSIDPKGYKVHSTNIDDEEFLSQVAVSTNKVILSTGGCYLSEIINAVELIINANSSIEIFLMTGIQNFPTLLSDTQLNRIYELKNIFKDSTNVKFGLQDHISGDDDMAFILPFIARTMNYQIIEKHITIDRSKKEEDYFSSLNPNEFKKLMENWKKFPLIFGNGEIPKTVLSKEEKQYRLFSKKYAVCKIDLKKGSKIDLQNFIFRRIDNDKEGLTRKSFSKLIGKTLNKSLKKNDIVYTNFINE